MAEPKVVFITGGSSGVGAEAARQYAAKGFKVALTGSTQIKVDAVVAECVKLSPNKDYVSVSLEMYNFDYKVIFSDR